MKHGQMFGHIPLSKASFFTSFNKFERNIEAIGPKVKQEFAAKAKAKKGAEAKPVATAKKAA